MTKSSFILHTCHPKLSLRAHKIIILLILLSFRSYSQVPDEAAVPAEKPKYYKVWAEVVNGDTIPSIRLYDFYVYGEYIYKNKRQYEAWTRTKYNVKKVYPYA